MRFAYELAFSRPRRKLTVVTKSNAQRHGMVLWDEIAAEVGREFPAVETDKVLVDAATTRMVGKPRSLDVIVATNLHADILSDLAAALAGSMGIAPTANLNPSRKFPSMFEPIIGSAFDIMGKGIANPIGSFWTAVMMLEDIWGEVGCGSEMLMAAIERVTASCELPGGFRRVGYDGGGCLGGLRGPLNLSSPLVWPLHRSGRTFLQYCPITSQRHLHSRRPCHNKNGSDVQSFF